MLRRDAGAIRLFGEPIDWKLLRLRHGAAGFVSETRNSTPHDIDRRYALPSVLSRLAARSEEKYLDLQLPRKKAVPKLSKGMRTQLMLCGWRACGTAADGRAHERLDPAMTKMCYRFLRIWPRATEPRSSFRRINWRRWSRSATASASSTKGSR